MQCGCSLDFIHLRYRKVIAMVLTFIVHFELFLEFCLALRMLVYRSVLSLVVVLEA